MKHKALKNTMVIFLLTTRIYLPSQNTPTDKLNYSAEELKQDFAVLRASLEEAHPGLYRYKTKAFMDSLFIASELSLVKPMSDREFTIFLFKVTSQIGDGHLKVVPPKVRLDSLDEGPTAIPFQVHYIQNKLFVKRNFSNIPDVDFLGAEIISINGHLIKDFLREFLLIFPSDGINQTHKYRAISAMRWFTRYYYILYGYSESYEVKYVPMNENIHKMATIKGLHFDRMLAIRKERYPQLVNEAPVEFRIDPDKKHAYLRISSFDKGLIKKNGISYSKFLKNTFKNLEKEHIDHLILDLRNNGGGTDEYGKELFSYFTDKNFDYYESIWMKKESFVFFKYTNRPDAKAPKGMLKANAVGSFDNVKHPNYGKQVYSKPTYKGHIYVLINGGCFSTTCEFLSVLHYNTKAVFIGEESGGGYYGNCSGPTPDLILPNSKVRLELPLMSYNMAVKNYTPADRGLVPDYVIMPIIAEIINNNDVEMNFVKSMIQ